MVLTYEGHDITRYVSIAKCICRDVSCGRADSMELVFHHAAAWYQWKPKVDDTISASLDGFSTGKMFLNAIQPEGDKIRMIATSLPSAARRRTWTAYRKMTLETIMRRCAAEIGLEAALYGVDGTMRYPFILRENEGSAAFLDRLGQMEGLAVKAVNGKMRGISVEYAQGLDAVKTFYIDPDRDKVTHTRQENQKYSTLTVLTPGARVIAQDSNAAWGNAITITGLSAMKAVQAGRWARGMLLMHNRQQERLVMKIPYEPSMCAMQRVDVDGTTDAKGAWIVDEAEQDLIDRSTAIKLVRVVTTIR